MQANKPEATAGYGHGESATSFDSFGWASHCLRLDSRRYRLRQRLNVARSCLLQPAPKADISLAVTHKRAQRPCTARRSELVIFGAFCSKKKIRL
jgi:hypothetical protein